MLREMEMSEVREEEEEKEETGSRCVDKGGQSGRLSQSVIQSGSQV